MGDRKPKRLVSQRGRPASPRGRFAPSKAAPGQEKEHPQHVRNADSGGDDLTALPFTQKLDRSPHLRPVEVTRPHIPYKFRDFSTSQASIRRIDSPVPPHREPPLRLRRSAYASTAPLRQLSRKKIEDRRLREEEIRAMSAPLNVPRRHGDGPLRRDSKRTRGTDPHQSVVSLPPPESIHSTMSGVAESRGWEIAGMGFFTPRPAVRLSGTPQKSTTYSSISNTSNNTPMSSPPRDKAKSLQTDDHSRSRKRLTIGNRANDFDASELRMLLERDAKRRERKKQAHHEKLDQKLQKRAGRNRGDSDKRRQDREAEELKRAEDARTRADEETGQRRANAGLHAVHPALRTRFTGEEDENRVAEGLQTTTGADYSMRMPVETPPRRPSPSNPRAKSPLALENLPANEAPPDEEPVVDSEREVRLSYASYISTPPLSRAHSSRAEALGISEMMRPQRASGTVPSKLTPQDRTSSDPCTERHHGHWVNFFRRGGTFSRKSDHGKSGPAEEAFSNHSRDSIRNQAPPVPPAETESQPSKPWTPTSGSYRTQSRFREDLPELPASLPSSRVPSPDVTMASAFAAQARRAHNKSQASPALKDAHHSSNEPAPAARSDTPLSPVRGLRHLSGSLASIDSEASWLASGSTTNRHSAQSALSRSHSKRETFHASHEDLSDGKDAENFHRGNSSSDSKRAFRPRTYAGAPLSGASPDEESELNLETTNTDFPTEPLTMHGSLRRRPQVIRHDPRFRSREGLLSEYSVDADSGSIAPSAADDAPEDLDHTTADPALRHATSVNYGTGGHARRISAGSARLLNVRRASSIGASAPSSPKLQPHRDVS